MSTEQVGDPLTPRQQREALGRATLAAQAGETKRMLEAFVESRVLEGLRRRVEYAWGQHIHPMDCDMIVGETVDAFYAAANRGDAIRDVGGWLSKVASNKASEFHRARQSAEPLDPDGHPARESDAEREITPAERQARRQRCLAVARSLLPLLSVSDNIRRVMAFIFDAVEQGVEDLQPVEVARALGVKESSIRTWIARGFDRLAARAKEAGYTRDEYELIQIEFEDEPVPDDDE